MEVSRLLSRGEDREGGRVWDEVHVPVGWRQRTHSRERVPVWSGCWVGETESDRYRSRRTVPGTTPDPRRAVGWHGTGDSQPLAT